MAFYPEAWVWPENPFSEMRWRPRPCVQLPPAHGGSEAGGGSGCPGARGWHTCWAGRKGQAWEEEGGAGAIAAPRTFLREKPLC